MLGIYCVSTGEPDSTELCHRLERTLPSIDARSVLTNAAGTLAACLLSPNYRRDSSSCEARDGDWVLIDGIALEADGSRPVTAETLLGLLRDRGPIASYELNGEFTILASIGQDVWLITDRMGQRQHCLARGKNSIAFAPSPGIAIELAKASPDIDMEAFFIFLLTNKLRLGEQTVWRHCETTPAASEYHLSPTGVLSHRQYWSLAYSPDPRATRERIIEEVSDIFRSAVVSRLPENAKVGMTLTGGLDSRLMAGSVPHPLRHGITCSTMGISGCDEIELAKAVAHRAGYRHRETAVTATTAFAPSNAKYLDGEDIDLVVQNCWQPFLQQNSDHDLLLHGLDLDVTLGGIYLTPELKEVGSFEQLTDYAVRHVLSSSFDELARLFRDEVMCNAATEIRDRIARMLSESREESILNTYDHFILRFSMHRVILQRYRSIRRYVDTLTPMYDRRLIDLYLRMPPELRSQHNIFRGVLLSICPDLADIAYQRTGLPPQVPCRFWRAGQHLEGEREELLRRIAHETNGGSFVPYKRYYTNVDEWLRFDPTWMRACDELLVSPASILRQRYVKPDRIDELIAEHRAHVRSHMKIIHILMSAELFLRRVRGDDLCELFERFGQPAVHLNVQASEVNN